MIRCRCRHESCGAEFDHHGHPHETTCCPECGRQQSPDRIAVNDSRYPVDERAMYDQRPESELYDPDPETKRRGGWGGW